ncbi:hypothetical protein GCM10010313_43570 [Streptomyces violarus]|uniref:Integral membrane protein n=1 Tax=Streptomyces violarus TaxID=67380 RepID=A0A7W4ZRY6_9ACTN|nr:MULTISPECIES: hypothetical protein [Streptomyces]MBB3077502.1 hypothetical protein [Streptomyces violarus]WRU00878.1 hypothetical protein VJ737_25790 [Streptomyces sp. CGMCC 4.1772]GHD15916.1 hypothetical protein GCM10010313_43570 [Streptomyces violarus]
MSKRQTQKMLRLMASGEPVELTSPMASVKKLARLAFVAQQFGYEYADVRQSSGRNGALTMLILPDPSPHARGRAAQNWAQYPGAADGVSLPPLVPDAFELLKARINFDLTGKSAEKRMGYAALGLTVGCVILAVRSGGEPFDFIMAGLIWLLFMAIFGIGLLVTRKRNAKFAARLQAAGFMPVTDENGRTRYLPPGAQLPGHGNPFGGGPYGGGPGAGAPGAGAPGYAGAAGQAGGAPGYGGVPGQAGGVPGQAPGTPGQAPGVPGQPPGMPGPAVGAPAGYGHQQPGPAPASGPYGQPAPGPYAQPGPGPYPPQPAPGPYGAQPSAMPYPQQQHPGPYAPQQPPHPEQNPHWQHPQR